MIVSPVCDPTNTADNQPSTIVCIKSEAPSSGQFWTLTRSFWAMTDYSDSYVAAYYYVSKGTIEFYPRHTLGSTYI